MRGLVLGELRPGRRAGVALAVAVVAMTALPLAAPYLTRAFVDEALAGAGTGRLGLLAVWFLAVAVAGQAARLVTAWLASGLAWDAGNRVRERLTRHALGLDMGYHGRRTPGEMIERVDGDVAALTDFAVAFLLDVVAGVLLLFGMLAVVVTIDPRLGAVLLAYCLLLGYGMVRAQRRTVPSGSRSREASAVLYGHMEERLAAAEDIRANGAGEHTVRSFHRVSSAWYRAERRDAFVGTGVIAGTSVAFAAGTALMLALAAWFASSGALSVGTAVLLLQYTLMVRTPFERLIGRLREYQDALAGAARIGGLLAERPRVTAPPAPVPLPENGPLGVEFQGVGFRYPDEDGSGERVLSDVTFALAPGETLGLVGRTGAGKTTIGRLVLRHYDPVAGSVRVGGADLRDTDPAELHRRLCVVTQDVQILPGSVRDNLTLFRPVSDDAPLAAALTAAGLGEWLERLPRGLDTELAGGQRAGLSAGQAQLLALARAFLARPGVVVLDEASSRLDPATERLVEDGVDRLLAGRTGILIAHRLSSLARVDKVAVVAGGRVVEFGSREELAADPGSRFAGMLRQAEVAW
ncbi:ABC transporter ATP-binding protein [Streptomyces sp. NPDC048845]|uniref:ABC transporter ATP-binding protein n=1 Tax=Streptomyces sp. NPDC048845 TaxID=3155390 RepID=UPI00341E3D25